MNSSWFDFYCIVIIKQTTTKQVSKLSSRIICQRFEFRISHIYAYYLWYSAIQISIITFQTFQVNNAIYADPGQNLCLMLWLEFTLVVFHTNLSTRLNLMHISDVIMSTKKYGHLKKMIFYITRDYWSEVLDIDKHVVGIFKEDRLVEHVPIELSQIISYFLQESETNKVEVVVNWKIRQLGLVVPSKYYARTETKWTVKIVGDQLKIIKEKYTHFSWQCKEQEMYYKTPIKLN